MQTLPGPTLRGCGVTGVSIKGAREDAESDSKHGRAVQSLSSGGGATAAPGGSGTVFEISAGT
ncbi:MAG: hypothetical protein ABSF64_00825 [Bryobacteraceae bacterium]